MDLWAASRSKTSGSDQSRSPWLKCVRESGETRMVVAGTQPWLQEDAIAHSDDQKLNRVEGDADR